MSRRKQIVAVALALLAIAGVALALLLADGTHGPAGRAPDPSRERYNVVLISIDTLRADRLGCYGYEDRPTSPVLDGIAREGVLFERYVASAPWTTPSHLSLLTSLYPSSHGVMASFSEVWRGIQFNERSYHKLPDSRVTLAEALAAAGFASAAFTGGGPLDPTIGFAQGFETYDTSMFKVDEDNFQAMTSWIGDHAEKQFFLFWHHFEVHAPYLHADFVADAAPGEQAAKIAEGMRAMAGSRYRDVWPGNAAHLRSRQTALLKEHGAFNRDVCEALYTSGVRSADRWLGRLVDELKRRKLYDRTLLVVTSDHGEEFGEHNKRLWYNHHGHILYEEMIHVPLVLKLPNGFAGGTRAHQICETVDVMPTILDLLDIAPAPNEMQGRSLAPLWSRPDLGDEDRAAFTESTVSKSEKKSVRTRHHKYIINIDQATVAELGRTRLPDGPLHAELYDLIGDPRERRNLLRADPSAKSLSLAADFERRLRRHLARQRGAAAPMTLGAEAIERLEGLGYLDDEPADAGR